MLAGSLMMGGKLGKELLAFATELMGRFRGGPLSTTVVASVVFGGVSGSAVANASALGSILIPWQRKQGYPAGLCAANNATSAVIDILIPPSIPMILFALVSGVSVADLFIAGCCPASSWQRDLSASAGGSRVGEATSPRRRPWVAASWRKSPCVAVRLC
jgi:tripartite ATP-independent transporter DctM subunit